MPRYRRRLLFVPLSIVFLVFAWADAGAGDDEVKTNLELAGELTSEVIEGLLAGVPAHITSREITLAPHASDEKYEFITNIFTRILTSKGYTIFAPRQQTTPGGVANPAGGMSDKGLKLEYQAIEFSLTYPRIYRAYLIGGKKVKRRADVRLYAELLDPSNGAVLWVGEESRSLEDQFPYGKISEVEAGLFEFSKPPRESTKWGKIIEPVVVSGIIVGLIYLFFSNQSGD